LFRRREPARQALIVLVVITILAATTGCGKQGAKHAAPRAKAMFVLIVSQSSCQENPGQAYVNCSVGVRNRGSKRGLPNVYVLYRYSDSGHNIDSYQVAVGSGSNSPSDPIPPHRLGYVYFSHHYNANQHDLIRAAASLDLNAKRWPYIRVANPNDANWPSG
jgi:hypothetical protein